MNKGRKRRGGHYPETIFVRASEEEKGRIYDRAANSNMSASRFLVRGALEGKAPPTTEECEELERLLRLFLRAHNSLTRLLANTRQMQLAGADSGIEAELQEVLRALATLIRRLRERL